MYMRLFVRSMTSPLKETADIACPIALLLRVHHCLRLAWIDFPTAPGQP